MKKKIFTFFLTLVASAGTMFAEAVQIGDLYYNLDSQNNTAEVTYHPWTDTYTRQGYRIDSILLFPLGYHINLLYIMLYV